MQREQLNRMFGVAVQARRAPDRPVAVPSPARPGAAVAQLANKLIGVFDPAFKPGVITEAMVNRDVGQPHTFTWPAPGAEAFFDPAAYGGSVSRAMAWGLAGGDGTAGWTLRQYVPGDFRTIANAAAAATAGLAAHAELNNEPNRTLVAIRAFRAGAGAGMAAQTTADLLAVRAALVAQQANLAAAGLSGPGAAITEIKSDPAEAHPNTLPTAKVTYNSGHILYFKGRSGAVEDALVGTGASAATAMSALPPAAGPEGVGSHGFLSAATMHAAADVGAAPAAGAVTRADAVSGWVAAAKTAALASLTGTSDLHASNVLAGASGKKHIIDAEFLLDGTMWDRYAAAAAANTAYNFHVVDMAPPWLTTYTQALSLVDKLSLGDDVAARFNALNIFQNAEQELVLAPIRALIAGNALVRVSPGDFKTDFWLTSITTYHDLGAGGPAYVQQIWDNGLVPDYAAHFHTDLDGAARAAGVAALQTNFENGMVPLFHVRTGDGRLMLNKALAIGTVRLGFRATDFLTLTKQAMTNGHANLLLQIRAGVIKA